jgi:hypothetical protein
MLYSVVTALTSEFASGNSRSIQRAALLVDVEPAEVYAPDELREY